MNLDIRAATARTLVLPDPKSVCITLVGCGGTGSWLAPHVARIARLWQNFHPGRMLKIVFYDDDFIEEKNTFRQNFITAEIGANKAEALASRYTFASGLEITACPRRFGGLSYSDREDLTIVLGCVDGPDGRIEIDRSLRNRSGDSHKLDIWVDCGNHKWSGQVLLSTSIPNEVPPFSLRDRCLWIPSPSLYHPELFEKEKDRPTRPALDQNISCAELAMMDHQGMSINAMVAAVAADYLVQILLTQNVTKFATYFSLEGNLPFNHRYLVPEEFEAIFNQSGRKAKKAK